MLRSLFHVGSAHVVGLGLSLVRNKVYALWLGTVGIGILSQLNNYLTLLSSLGTLSTSKGIVKHVSQFRAEGRIEKLRVMMSSVLVVFTVVSLLLTLAGLFIPESLAMLVLGRQYFRGPVTGAHCKWGDISATFLVIFATLPIVFLVWKALLDALIIGYKDTRRLLLDKIIGNTLALAALVPLVYFWGVHGAAIGFLVVAVIALLTTFYYAQRAVRPEKLLAVGERLVDSRLLRPVLYFGLAGAIGTTATNLANLFVRRQIIDHMGIQANGVFQAAWALSHQLMPLLLVSLGAYFFPRLCEISEPTKTGRETVKGLELAMVLCAPFVALVITFREELIYILYTSAFLAASKPLVCVIVAEFVGVVWWALSNAMAALGRLRVVTLLAVVSQLILCAGAYLTAGRYGQVGVALSYGIANLFLAFTGVLWAKYRLKMKFRWLLSLRTISSVLLVAVSVGLCFVRFHEQLLVPAVVVVYVALFVISKPRSVYDRNLKSSKL